MMVMMITCYGQRLALHTTGTNFPVVVSVGSLVVEVPT